MENHHNSSCLIRCMDHLWLHQTILHPPSIPISPFTPSKSLNTPIPRHDEESMDLMPQSSSPSSTSSSSSALPPVINSQLTDSKEEGADSSTSPSTSESWNHGKVARNLLRRYRKNKGGGGGGVRRSMSCNEENGGRGSVRRSMSLDRSSPWDLELEEVKGFMDLGFRFEKEHLCPELTSVVPGLQRRFSNNGSSTEDDEDDAQKESATKSMEEVEVTRPYLSEAWLIRRPNSPLLNLRMPSSVSNPADMKKHLRCWAITVASEILHD